VEIVAPGVHPEEHLVVEILVVAIDPPGLVERLPVAVLEHEEDPELPLLAEAARDPVPGADVLALDRDLEPAPRPSRRAQAKAEGVAQEQVPAPPRRERDAVDVH